MMDLREIIKWFIPCFHILRTITKLKGLRMMLLILLFIFMFNVSFAAEVGVFETKNVDSYFNSFKLNQSDVSKRGFNTEVSVVSATIGGLLQEEAMRPRQWHTLTKLSRITIKARTFGRPFKKMAQALIPLVFQIGAASTWAVVAALVGIKTLAVALIILKLLLVAGAAKLGALFGQKHGGQWAAPHEHPQKEIHLHIHNGHHDEHSPYSWSRDGTVSAPAESKKVVVVDPYAAGPQTISTPYGNYVRVHPGTAPASKKRK